MTGLTRQQLGVLTAASAANSLIFLDQTSVTVALSAIQRDFGSSTAEVQWTIGAYLLSLAALMAGSGRVADLYGRRRMFLLGVALFGVASVACAAAPSESALIVARFVQGAGAALTQPLALAHATAIMPPERRGWVIGVLAGFGTTFLMIGPLLGGVLVETLGWRWVFLANVPVVLVSLAFAVRFMPESREPAPPPLDLPGLVLLTAGLALLVAGLLHLNQWPLGLAAGVLAASALTLAAFVAVERRTEHALIPVYLLERPEVAGSMVALVAIQGSVLGVTVYVVLFLQNGLGLTAIQAGAVLLPAMIWSALLSARTGRLADRHGERLLVGFGLLVTAAGLAAIGVSARGGGASARSGFAAVRYLTSVRLHAGRHRAVEGDRSRRARAGLEPGHRVAPGRCGPRGGGARQRGRRVRGSRRDGGERGRPGGGDAGRVRGRAARRPGRLPAPAARERGVR